ncbi:hypothetical protein, partial [Stenotrophomonas maltophilia]|uniref:hypothetical protein n=1 Tax=Stenotrophomonas maltophilia TaxID=40324 RepID=UPI001CCCF126
MAPTVLRRPIRPCSTASRATVRKAKKSRRKEPGIARLFAFQAQSLRRDDVLPPARETVWRRWGTLARTVRRMDAPIEP